MPEFIKNKSTKRSEVPIIKILSRLTVVLLINILTISLLCMYFYFRDTNVFREFIVILTAFSVADFISSYYIGKKTRKNGMIYGIVYNLPVIVLIILISLILNSFTFDVRLLFFAVIRIILSAAGGITAVNTKSKRK